MTIDGAGPDHCIARAAAFFLAPLTPSATRSVGRVPAERRAGGVSPRDGSSARVPLMKPEIAFARSLRKRMTPEEVKLWVRLREWRQSRGYHFRRQAPV